MKIDRSKLKSKDSPKAAESSTCGVFIEQLKATVGPTDLTRLLNVQIDKWSMGKSDLVLWIDVLDKFDEALGDACKRDDGSWVLKVDRPEESGLRHLVVAILNFTACLFENAGNKSLYQSTEHVITLLESGEFSVIVAALTLLYTCSKRNIYLSHLSEAQNDELINKFELIAESWGGAENGFALAKCCGAIAELPATRCNLHYEYHDTKIDAPSTSDSSTRVVHVENVDKLDKTPAELMDDIVKNHSVPKDKQIALFNQLRLVFSFGSEERRWSCILARLQAISTLIYWGQSQATNLPHNFAGRILYSGFVEECVDVLKLDKSMQNPSLTLVKTEVFKTLTAVIFYDRAPRLSSVIEATGANAFHGLLPSMLRECVQIMTTEGSKWWPVEFVTSFFSFIYHFASNEVGTEALSQSNCIEPLLSLVGCYGVGSDRIPFVTRAVRVIDQLIAPNIQVFQQLNGMSVVLGRFEYEINQCRKEEPYEMELIMSHAHGGYEIDTASIGSPAPADMEQEGVAAEPSEDTEHQQAMETSNAEVQTDGEEPAAEPEPPNVLKMEKRISIPGSTVSVSPQRSAFCKSVFNFLKHIIHNSNLAETVRHLFDGVLTSLICHVVSNPVYYGPGLFHQAIHVVNQFIYQEPSQLSTLQDKGLTDCILFALLIEDIPASKDLLTQLPNIFGSLCLNQRGLDAFTACKPFEKLFRVLLSPDFLSTMKHRRRHFDMMSTAGDHNITTAAALGSAVDELMRHQPSLKADAMQAIIKLLDELCELGSDPTNTCTVTSKSKDLNDSGTGASTPTSSMNHNADMGGNDDNTANDDSEFSDADDDNSTDAVTTPPTPQNSGASSAGSAGLASAASSKPPSGLATPCKNEVPILDYIYSVMKFLDATLANNATEDHCKEFIAKGGLVPLLKILALPILPPEFAASNACIALTSVFKTLVQLTKDRTIIEAILKQFLTVLETGTTIFGGSDMGIGKQSGSVLVQELLTVGKLSGGGSSSGKPVMKFFCDVQAYSSLLASVCRLGTAQVRSTTEIKQMLLGEWVSDTGRTIVRNLMQTYRELIWESSTILTLCNADANIPENCKFALEQFKMLQEYAAQTITPRSTKRKHSMTDDVAPMEVDTVTQDVSADTSTDARSSSKDASTDTSPDASKMTSILKPLIDIAAKVGATLSDTFGILVKLCLGLTVRQRRGQPPYPLAPPANGIELASQMCECFADALNWRAPADGQDFPSKLIMNYYICLIHFVAPLLFDHRRYAYMLFLDRFYHCGAQTAFVDTLDIVFEQFKNAETGAKNFLQERGIVEFLESWLNFVEKMVSPAVVSESPNQYLTAGSTSAAGKPVLDGAMYLKVTQRAVFDQVVKLWEQSGLLKMVAGGKIPDLILLIFCHILKAESQSIKKSDKAKQKEAKTEPERPPEPDVVPEELQQLLDMGFARERAIAALTQMASLQEAMDLLCEDGMTNESEEDQLRQALMMSLGDEASGENSSAGPDSSSMAESPVVDTVVVVPPVLSSKPVPIEQADGINPDDFDQFVRCHLMPGVFVLLDESIDGLVYRITDLFVLGSTRMGDDWRDVAIENLCMEVASFIKKTESKKLSVENSARLHLLCLLFEQFREVCAKPIGKFSLIPMCLTRLSEIVSKKGEMVTEFPVIKKILTPMLLLLDLYEKHCSIYQHKRQLVESGTVFCWKFWNDTKWSSFTPSVQHQIDEALKSGVKVIKFSLNRRRYQIDLSTWQQRNEDTGFQRAVTKMVDREQCDPQQQQKPKPDVVEASASTVTLDGLSRDQKVFVIETCVELIDMDIDPDTLNAAMRLCLRLTRDHQLAMIFATNGGLQKLLKIRHSKGFAGFATVAPLLLRHVIEDTDTLRNSMEKVVLAATHSAISTSNNSKQAMLREFYNVMRQLNPVACRDPQLFVEVATSLLKIKVPPPKNGSDTEEALLKTDAILDLIRVPDIPPRSTPPLDPQMKEIISLLLNTLVLKDEIGSTSEEKPRDLKLVKKAAILRLLSELIRSYYSVAPFIIHYVYAASDAEDTLIKEECTGLSFMLDHLLISNSKATSSQSDGKTAAHGDDAAQLKVLLGTLAAATHCPEAQVVLVGEIKTAIIRACQLPESTEKHKIMVALVGLIALVKEACPNPPAAVNQPQPAGGHRPPPPQKVQLNNVVKVMIKKKIIPDLAKIPRSLDLSSPLAISTVNAILKPLEELTKAVNQPSYPGSGFSASGMLRPAPDGRRPVNPLEMSASRIMNNGAMMMDDFEPEAMVRLPHTSQPDAELTSSTNAGVAHGAGEGTPADGGDASTAEASATATITTEATANEVAHSQAQGDMTHVTYSLDADGGTDIELTRHDPDEAMQDQNQFSLDDDEDAIAVSGQLGAQLGMMHRFQMSMPISYDASANMDSSNDDDGHTVMFDERNHEIPGLHDDDDDDDDEDDDDDDNDSMVSDTVGPQIIIDGDVFNEGDDDDEDDEEDDEMDYDDDDDEGYDGANTDNGNVNLNIGEDGEDDDDADDDQDDDSSDDGADDELFSYADALDGMMSRDVGLEEVYSILTNQLRRDFGEQLAAGGGNQSTIFRLRAPEHMSDLLHLYGGSNVPLTIGDLGELNVPPVHPMLVRHAEPGPGNGGLSGPTAGPMAIQPPAGLVAAARAAAPQTMLDRHGGGRHRQTALVRQGAVRQRPWSRWAGGHDHAGLAFGNHFILSTGGTGQPGMQGISAFAQPAVIQRLLGHDTTRHLVDGHWVGPSDDSNMQGALPLGKVPTALTRWSDEMKILDGDDSHQILSAVLPNILSGLLVPYKEDVDKRRVIREKMLEVEKVEKSKCAKVIASGEKPPLSAPTALIDETEQDEEDEGENQNDLVVGSADVDSALEHATGSENTSQRMDVDDMFSVVQITAEAAERASAAVLLESVLMPPPAVPAPSVEPPPTINIPPVEMLPAVEASNLAGDSENGQMVSARSSQSSLYETPGSSVNDETTTATVAPVVTTDVSVTPETTSVAMPEVPASSAVESPGEPMSDPVAGAPMPEASGAAAAAAAPPDPTLVELRNILGPDAEIPEGIDPSFLLALPDELRNEVIESQLRMQRLAAQNQAAASGGAAPTESAGTSAASAAVAVDPEFVAALPPEIQEEVLTQQRMAQALQQQANRPAVPTPVDNASLFDSLPPGMRESLLIEMDDSQLETLPEPLLAEARRLRERHIARAVRAMQHQQHGMQIGTHHNMPTGRFHNRIRGAPGVDVVFGRRGEQNQIEQIFRDLGAQSAPHSTGRTNNQTKGQQLLDKEALSNLLALFFVDDQRLDVGRLQRIIKNLCHHAPTRDWVIRTLLSIIDRAQQQLPHGGAKRKTSAAAIGSNPWANLSVTSAFGQKAPVFQFESAASTAEPSKVGRKATAMAKNVHNVTFHPKACATVCNNALEALNNLAKLFPQSFIPSTSSTDKDSNNEPSEVTSPRKTRSASKSTGGPATPVTPAAMTKPTTIPPAAADQCSLANVSDFWEILFKADADQSNTSTLSKKGKSPVSKMAGTGGSSSLNLNESAKYASFDTAPFGWLMGHLNHDVIKSHQNLMDKLLKLLSTVMKAIGPTKQDSLLVSTSKSTSSSTSAQKSTPKAKKQLRPNLEAQLELVVNVLAEGLCSDDGLESVRELILQLVRAFGSVTQEMILKLLVKNVRALGEKLCEEIVTLLQELHDLQQIESNQEEPSTSNVPVVKKGIIADRYANTDVVISATDMAQLGQMASSKELKLASMAELTKKDSHQKRLLRSLNTIMTIRVAIKYREDQILRNRKEAAKVLAEAAAKEETAQEMETDDSEQPPKPAQKSASSESTASEKDAQASSSNDEANSLSSLVQLDSLWNTLSECLNELEDASDANTVLLLQPAVEAFFLVHGSFSKENKNDTQLSMDSSQLAPASPQPMTSSESEPFSELSSDREKFLRFAEQHRKILNQILRQSSAHLSEGPFSVLVDHTKLLDFDIKRKYFRRELDNQAERMHRDDKAIKVHRNNVFQESFRELHRFSLPDWKCRLYIIFVGEEGQDAGGLLREWFIIITREIFNPNYALFTTAPGDRVTYMINPSSYINSEHLEYFRFVGRIIAKAIYDNKLLDCYFTRAFYRHILGKRVRYTDMESEDPAFFQSLGFLKENPIESLGYDLTFEIEVEEFGNRDMRELKPGGSKLLVTDDNKDEYAQLVCQMKMTGAIRQQLNAFTDGFYDIIPQKYIGIFNEQELELLISGLPEINIDDLRANTEYIKFNKDSLQIQWFWRALRSFDQAARAIFLQFVTGTSKVPLQGFAHLEGMNGPQKFQITRDDRATDRLPTAHTCFNQLDLPVYETYDKLRHMLSTAIHECSEGFGFA